GSMPSARELRAHETLHPAHEVAPARLPGHPGAAVAPYALTAEHPYRPSRRGMPYMSVPWIARLREERTRDRVVRTVRLPGQEIWWDITGGSLPPKLSRHDQAAVALVFHAMRHGQSLRIDGPVSAHLLEQLENFIGCWTSWRPDLYRKIDVSA